MARLLFEKLTVIASLSEAWRGLRIRVSDPYRPERHYMRGPGPKSHAKRAG